MVRMRSQCERVGSSLSKGVNKEPKGGRVRRKVLLCAATTAALVILGSGMALAETIRCDGGRCDGTNLTDVLKGSAVRDVMYGLRADDELYGNVGDDELHGDAGNDTIKGGSGGNEMYGEAGNDLLQGGSGDEDMNGGPGTDRLYSADGGDRLSGGLDRDRMSGGLGRDELLGGEDDDTIGSQDGVFDVVDCGPGDYDAVVIDRGLDSVRNCENVIW
jgi:hypothetical protein